MTPRNRFRPVVVVAGAAVAVAAVLLFAPVRATYINDVGSDTIEMRTASCGAAVATLLGAEPGWGGGTVHRLGPEGPRAACDAAAGKRVGAGLFLLLAVSTAGWARAVKARTRASDSDTTRVTT